MKKIFLLVISILAFSFVLAGCGKSEAVLDDALVGTWNYELGEDENGEFSYLPGYIFNDDLTGTDLFLGC